MQIGEVWMSDDDAQIVDSWIFILFSIGHGIKLKRLTCLGLERIAA